MRDYLAASLDQEVLASVGRADGPGGRGPRGPDDTSSVDIGNQAPGTLVALPDAGQAFVLGNGPGDADELDADDVTSLASVPVDRRRPHRRPWPAIATA